MVARATCNQLAGKVEADMQSVLKYSQAIKDHADKQDISLSLV